METDTNCHTNKVLRVNLHNLIVGCSVLRDSGILAELRNLVVNIFFVNSNQGLNKVVLIQVLTARVDTNKDICHILLVRIYGDFQSRKGEVFQTKKVIQIVFNQVKFFIRQFRFAFFASGIVQSVDICTTELGEGVAFFCQEDIADFGYPFLVTVNSGCPNGKFSGQRVITDFDFSLAITLVSNLDTVHCSDKGSQSLLTVNNQFFRFFIDFLVATDRTLLFFVIGRRLPQHHISDRISTEHRVKKVSDFIILPYERSLQVRQTDFTDSNIIHEVLNLAWDVSK